MPTKHLCHPVEDQPLSERRVAIGFGGTGIITIQALAAATDTIPLPTERDDLENRRLSANIRPSRGKRASSGHGVQFEDQEPGINHKKA